MFVTYGLVWSDGVGVHPGLDVSQAGATLTPTEWLKGSGEDTQILGVIEGEIDLTDFSDYNMTEISDANALAWAQEIEPDAVLADGVITSANRAYPRWDEDAGDWVAVPDE